MNQIRRAEKRHRQVMGWPAWTGKASMKGREPGSRSPTDMDGIDEEGPKKRSHTDSESSGSR